MMKAWKKQTARQLTLKQKEGKLTHDDIPVKEDRVVLLRHQQCADQDHPLDRPHHSE